MAKVFWIYVALSALGYFSLRASVVKTAVKFVVKFEWRTAEMIEVKTEVEMAVMFASEGR